MTPQWSAPRIEQLAPASSSEAKTLESIREICYVTTCANGNISLAPLNS